MTFFHEAAQEVGLRPQTETTGLLQPYRDSDGLPQRASLDRLAHVWILHSKDMIFAVTSYLRPAARHPGATTSSTPNLTEQMKQTAGTHDYNATIRHDNSNRSTTNTQARSVVIFGSSHFLFERAYGFPATRAFLVLSCPSVCNPVLVYPICFHG